MKEVTVTITTLGHDGRGIGHIDGKTIFIEGGLIGEQVELEFVKKRSRFDEAKVKKVLVASDQRVQPECAAFGVCGGCSLQHMSAQMQLELKQQVLLEQLHHIGKVQPRNVADPIKSPSWGYRRKARLGVKYVVKKDKLLIGFRERNGRYLADIDSCPVLHPSVGNKLTKLSALIMRLESYLHIPQIEVAVGDDNTALIIRHLQTLPHNDIAIIIEFAIAENLHIYLQPGGAETVTLLHPHNGNSRLSYRLGKFNLELLFHPNDFTQVNTDINQQLVSIALNWLEPKSNEQFLDLFCGIGNFTLPLAKHCQHVIGVEGSELMVKRGYENANHNAITNADFICKNLATTDYNDSWTKGHFDGVLLDPPRTGAWEAIQRIPKWNPARVVYVSCNPATLARDAGYLGTQGYDLVNVGVLDMFPHTSHVESIALFTRN